MAEIRPGQPVALLLDPPPGVAAAPAVCGRAVVIGRRGDRVIVETTTPLRAPADWYRPGGTRDRRLLAFADGTFCRTGARMEVAQHTICEVPDDQSV